MRRITAAVIAALLVAGPAFATELDVKKKREDAAKEEAEAAKAAEPTPAACQDKAAPLVGTAGFFQTVEDIYGFEGPVAALAPTAPTPAAPPAVAEAIPAAKTPSAPPTAATPPAPVAPPKASAEKPKDPKASPKAD